MKISDALIVLGVAGIAVFATRRYTLKSEYPPLPVGAKGPFGNFLDALWPDSHLYTVDPDYDETDPADTPVKPEVSPANKFYKDHVAGNRAGIIAGTALGVAAIALAIPTGGGSIGLYLAGAGVGAVAGSAIEDTVEKHKPWKGWLPFV